MINEQHIKALTEQKIGGTALFLVDVKVKPLNKIEVFIDAPSHISVNECVTINKYIEAGLNRDEEDFELTVSSPGIDQPFKVLSQYRKYLGREVSVLKKDGFKVIGKLNMANEDTVEIETKRTERKPARRSDGSIKEGGEKGKGRHTIIENVVIDTNLIKETKLILPF